MIKKEKIPKNFSNQPLETTILNLLQENSKENQDALISELINTHLFTLMDIEEKEKDSQKNTINLLQTINENKEAFLPMYTSEKEMKKAIEKFDFEQVLLSFDEISNMIQDQTSDFKGFIINPDSQNIIIDNELINYIQENRSFLFKDGSFILEDGQIQVEDISPEEYPQDMIDALVKHFKKEKNISSAYITNLYYKGQKSRLLITDFSGNKEETFSKISGIVKPFLYNIFLDQLEYDTQLAQEITKDMTPFYVAKKRFF